MTTLPSYERKDDSPATGCFLLDFDSKLLKAALSRPQPAEPDTRAASRDFVMAYSNNKSEVSRSSQSRCRVAGSTKRAFPVRRQMGRMAIQVVFIFLRKGCSQTCTPSPLLVPLTHIHSRTTSDASRVESSRSLISSVWSARGTVRNGNFND